ncbi:MAG: VIT1/CCC1 transporter family protein [Leucobacter sp.]
MNDQPVNLANPHEYDHTHSSSAGSGWLRAAVFGAMDGLVSNIGLIAGIAAAGASSGLIAITGVSGLIAGAISMALGEYTSVRTQNEQLAVEVQTERAALNRNPEGEQAELAVMFENLGMTEQTARDAATQVHADNEQALKVHLAHELGLTPDDRPSPMVAAVSSLAAFSVGAVIPVIPFFFAFGTLLWGLVFGGVGLLAAGFIAAKFTDRNPVTGAMRQLVFGGVAVAATYLIGKLLGVSALG